MAEERSRPHSFHLRLTDEELINLQRQSAKAGLKPQAYILSLLAGYELKERPSPDLFELLNLLQSISINLNQIARKANSLNFVDTSAYWENADDLERIKGKLLEVMYG
jgi:hypothetical protein